MAVEPSRIFTTSVTVPNARKTTFYIQQMDIESCSIVVNNSANSVCPIAIVSKSLTVGGEGGTGIPIDASVQNVPALPARTLLQTFHGIAICNEQYRPVKNSANIISSVSKLIISDIRSNAFKSPSVWADSAAADTESDQTASDSVTNNSTVVISKEVIYDRYYDPLVQIDNNTAAIITSSFGLPGSLHILGSTIYGKIDFVENKVFTINLSNGKKVIIELNVKIYETLSKEQI